MVSVGRESWCSSWGIFSAQEIRQNTTSLDLAARESQTTNAARINELVVSNEILSASLAKIEFHALCSRPDVELISKLTPQERELAGEASLQTLAGMTLWMQAFELPQTRAEEHS